MVVKADALHPSNYRALSDLDRWLKKNNIPGIAGIEGDSYNDPIALNAGFRTSVLISAGLVVAAAVVSFIFIRRPRDAPAPERVRVEDCFRCEVNAPMPHPADR